MPVKKEGFKYVPEGLIQFCIPIGKVKFWDKNPRKNDEAAKKLAELIKIHGFRKPIVIDKNYVTYAGNTALKAAKILGMTHIPVAQSSFKSEVSATAYGISDNKASEFSSWDDEQLLKLMNAEIIEAKKIGFSEKEHNTLLASMTIPDDLPDVDLIGGIDGKSGFMVIQFENKIQLREFNEFMGYDAKQRIVPYKDLMGKMRGKKCKN